MKKILNALGKALAFLGIGIGVALVPIVTTNLLGPVGGLVVTLGGIVSVLFYLIYKAEK
jgi:hypothetical protein